MSAVAGYVAERFGCPVGVGATAAEACRAAEMRGVRGCETTPVDTPGLRRAKGYMAGLRRAFGRERVSDRDLCLYRLRVAPDLRDGLPRMAGDEEEWAEADAQVRALEAELDALDAMDRQRDFFA